MNWLTKIITCYGSYLMMKESELIL